jgi:hypothetical protein
LSPAGRGTVKIASSGADNRAAGLIRVASAKSVGGKVMRIMMFAVLLVPIVLLGLLLGLERLERWTVSDREDS